MNQNIDWSEGLTELEESGPAVYEVDWDLEALRYELEKRMTW